MKCGNAHDRLRLGFNACDRDWDGRVTRAEVTMLIAFMFSAHTGLLLDPQNPYVEIFISSLFGANFSDKSMVPPDDPPAAYPIPVLKSSFSGISGD